MYLPIINKVNIFLKKRAQTDPIKAKEGTLRKMYGISIDKNSVHGSDTSENAKTEIGFFFNK